VKNGFESIGVEFQYGKMVSCIDYEPQGELDKISALSMMKHAVLNHNQRMHALNGNIPSKHGIGMNEWSELPQYGNYCGKNRSGGKHTHKIDFRAMPIDETDRACQNHDFGYALGQRKSADLEFVETLDNSKTNSFKEAGFNFAARNYFRAKNAFWPDIDDPYEDGIRSVEADEHNASMHALNGNVKTKAQKNKARRARQKAKKQGAKTAIVVALPQRPRQRRVPKFNNNQIVAVRQRPVHRRNAQRMGPVMEGGQFVGNAELRVNHNRPPVYKGIRHKRYGQGINMSGTDLLASIGPPGTVYTAGQVIFSIAMNPTYFNNTRMQQQSRLWSMYKINWMDFDFQTSLATSSSGSFIMFPDYDARDALPANDTFNIYKATSHYETMETNIYQSKMCRFRGTGIDPKYVQPGNSAGVVSDATITSEGIFNIVALTNFMVPTGDNNNSGMGTMKIRYSVDFFINELQESPIAPEQTNAWLLNGYSLSGGTATSNMVGNTSYSSTVNALNGPLNNFTLPGGQLANWYTVAGTDRVINLPYDAQSNFTTNCYLVAISTNVGLATGGPANCNSAPTSGGAFTEDIYGQVICVEGSAPEFTRMSIITVTAHDTNAISNCSISFKMAGGLAFTGTTMSVRIFIMMMDVDIDQPALSAKKLSKMKPTARLERLEKLLADMCLGKEKTLSFEDDERSVYKREIIPDFSSDDEEEHIKTLRRKGKEKGQKMQ